MKTSLFSMLVALATFVSATAQESPADPFATLSRECNAMRPGDAFDMIAIPVINPGVRGTGQTWHIPTDIDGNDHSRKYLMKGDTLVCLEYPEYLTYDITGDTLLLTSVENREMRIDYDRAPPVLRLPMAYGDSVFSPTYGRGLYGKRIYIGHRGTAYTVADGTGILACGTDTLRHVLRVHSHHEYRRVMSPDTTQVAVWMASDDLINDSLPVFTEERYSWYRAGSRYPVMESVTTSTSIEGSNLPLSSETLLYLPELQRTDLGEDPENRALLARIALTDGNTPSEGEYYDTPVNFPATVDAVIGSDGNTVNVTFSLDTEADVRLGVFDSLGRSLSSITRLSTPPGTHHECLTLTSTPSGNALLTVWVNDANMTFKVRTE